ADQTVGSVGTERTVREIVVVFVKLPETPVMVTVAVPVVAVLPALSVRVLVFVVLVGLNDAVTPLGKPEADRLTLPLKLFCGLIVMVLVPAAPCVIVKLFGEPNRAELGGGFTDKEMEVVLDKLPDEPVTVMVAIPVVAALLAVSINVLVFFVLVGLNDAVTPLGKPDADNLTLPLKLFCGMTVMVVAPLVP